MRRSRADQPLLITSAPESSDDEYGRRRKRYGIMMTGRVLCVILAATTYRISIWLALAFVVVGAVLPWAAVILANDRPPKKRPRPTTGSLGNREKALPGDIDRTIDG